MNTHEKLEETRALIKQVLIQLEEIESELEQQSKDESDSTQLDDHTMFISKAFSRR